MNKNTIIAAVLKGIMNNRKQITRTMSNIMLTVARAMLDEKVEHAGYDKKWYRDI